MESVVQKFLADVLSFHFATPEGVAPNFLYTAAGTISQWRGRVLQKFLTDDYF